MDVENHKVTEPTRETLNGNSCKSNDEKRAKSPRPINAMSFPATSPGESTSPMLLRELMKPKRQQIAFDQQRKQSDHSVPSLPFKETGYRKQSKATAGLYSTTIDSRAQAAVAGLHCVSLKTRKMNEPREPMMHGVNGVITTDRFLCGVCKSQFTDLKDFLVHRPTHNEMGHNSKIRCELCDTFFPTKSAVLLHYKVDHRMLLPAPQDKPETNLQFKKKVLAFAEYNGNRQTAEQFNISESCVRLWKRHKDAILACTDAQQASVDGKCRKFNACDKEVEERRKLTLPVTRGLVKEKAKEVDKSLDIPSKELEGTERWAAQLVTKQAVVERRKEEPVIVISEDDEPQEKVSKMKPAIKSLPRIKRVKKRRGMHWTRRKLHVRPPKSERTLQEISNNEGDTMDEPEGCFPCPVCGIVFDKLVYLNKHTSLHDGLQKIGFGGNNTLSRDTPLDCTTDASQRLRRFAESAKQNGAPAADCVKSGEGDFFDPLGVCQVLLDVAEDPEDAAYPELV